MLNGKVRNSVVLLAILASVLWPALTATPALANPGILRVKVNGITSGVCGGTWATACGLQHALKDLAVSGDQLWVAAGMYKPTTGTDRMATFQLRSGIALYGGFAGTETLLSQRNWKTNVTVLSGDIGVAGNRTDNVYHVVTGSRTNSTAVLDGFTVTGGYANGGTWQQYGAGMYNYLGSPTLTNLVFAYNLTGFGGLGAAMFNYNHSNPALTNVTFHDNVADNGFGGGMYNVYYSSPTLTAVTFNSNFAGSYGGAMSNENFSDPVLTNVTIANNTAYYGGGAIDIRNYGSVTLTNVTISNNKLTNPVISVRYGGAINNYGGRPLSVRNSIIYGNSAPQLYGGNFGISYTDVQGGYAGTGNISGDPHLGLLGNYGGDTQTVPLRTGSAAVNAANSAWCPPTDQRGVPRPAGQCDMGAFEGVIP